MGFSKFGNMCCTVCHAYPAALMLIVLCPCLHCQVFCEGFGGAVLLLFLLLLQSQLPTANKVHLPFHVEVLGQGIRKSTLSAHLPKHSQHQQPWSHHLIKHPSCHFKNLLFLLLLYRRLFQRFHRRSSLQQLPYCHTVSCTPIANISWQPTRGLNSRSNTWHRYAYIHYQYPYQFCKGGRHNHRTFKVKSAAIIHTHIPVGLEAL